MSYKRARAKVDKTPYTLHRGLNAGGGAGETPPDSAPRPFLQVVSVDPAEKNLALRIERRWADGRIEALAFAKVDVRDEVHSDGAATVLAAAELPAFAAGEPNFRLGAGKVSAKFRKITEFLDQYDAMYRESDVFIVERQLDVNYKAIRVSQHVIAYFMLASRDSPMRPLIVEVDSQLKGRQLGAPKGIKGPQLKTWAVEVAHMLLAARADVPSLEALRAARNKQDDLADTVCQIEALWRFWGLQPSPEIPAADVAARIEALLPPFVPPPRKRAPRKAAVAPVPAEGAPAPAPKPRGRPPKVPVRAPISEGANVDPALTMPAPKPRGRPPKVAVPAPISEGANVEPAPTFPARKPRGRPPKAAAATVGPALTASTSSVEPPIDILPPAGGSPGKKFKGGLPSP